MLSDITTRAVSDGADAALGSRYRLFGNKMWISGGDHDMADNIVHLVLAKVPGDDGRIAARAWRESRCSSCRSGYPRANGELGERNDITVMGLNHKMGYRGTTNCLLAFRRRLAASPGRTKRAPSVFASARSGRVSPSCFR